MLFKLLNNTTATRSGIKVISLSGANYYVDKIKSLGINVYIYDLNNINPTLIYRLYKECRQSDIIQTWMYHADLIGLLVKLISPRKIKLIWGIRHSNLSYGKNKLLTLIIAKVNAILSSFPNVILSNSHRGVVEHKKYGYNSKNMVVIPNGFDELMFKRSINEKNLFLKNIGKAGKELKIILHIARWDVQKNHIGFIQSLQYLRSKNMNFLAIMCGANVDKNNKDLMATIRSSGLSDYIILLGEKKQINKILSIGDIFVSSSIGEGFSNIIAEAMLCENICVVTDVGDSRTIVEPYGIVVKDIQPKEIARGILRALTMEEGEMLRRKVGGRAQIINKYSINNVVQMFENHYVI